MLARVQVEHELDQRPLQPRAGAGETNESASAQLGRAFRVEEIQLCAERDMIQHRKIELRFLAPAPHDRVVGRGGSDRRVGMGKVWDIEQ